MRLFSFTHLAGPAPWAGESLAAALPCLDGVVLLTDPPGRETAAALAEPLAAFAGPTLQLTGEGGPSSRPPLVHAAGEADPSHRSPLVHAAEEASRAGASHLLLLDPNHIYPAETLHWCRRLLAEVELKDSALSMPPFQHDRRHDPQVTDGVLIRHLALIPRPATAPGIPQGPPGEPQIRIFALAGTGIDPTGQLVEATGEPLATSPYRLILPNCHFWVCP